MINLIIAQPSWEGDFSNPGDVSGALNSGQLSVSEAIGKVNDATLEKIFSKVKNEVKSQIIKKKFHIPGFSMAQGADIKSFSNGIISTEKVASFNLKNYENFQGKITVNNDGSIDVQSDKQAQGNTDVEIGNEKVQLTPGSALKIKGSSVFEILPGSKIEYKGVTLESNVADNMQVFFDNKNREKQENTVQFKTLTREININANDIILSVSAESSYEIININGGNNIRIINGEINVLYLGDKVIQQAPFGIPEKNTMFLNDRTNKDIYHMDKRFINLKPVNVQMEFDKSTGFDLRGDGRVHGYTDEESYFVYGLTTSFDGRVAKKFRKQLDALMKQFESSKDPNKLEYISAIKSLQNKIQSKYKREGKRYGIGYSNIRIDKIKNEPGYGSVSIIPTDQSGNEIGGPVMNEVVPAAVAEGFISDSVRHYIKVKG